MDLSESHIFVKGEIEMSKINARTKRIVIATTALVAIGGGAAVAYWTAAGQGAAVTDATGTSAAFVVTAANNQAGALTPGGPVETVNFTVSHTGTGTQRLTSVVASVANPDGSTWTAVPGCSAADFTVGTPSIAGGPGDIPKDGSKNGTVTLTMKNLDSDQNACKSVTVPLYFTAS